MQERRICDVFISYSHKDSFFVSRLVQELNKHGVSVFMDTQMELGDDWQVTIANAISSSRWFIPIITPNSLSSQYFLAECRYACVHAEDRSKMIYPICYACDIHDVINSRDKRHEGIISALYNLAWGVVHKGCEEELAYMAERIAKQVLSLRNDHDLFERISSCVKAGEIGKATEGLCDLIQDICQIIYNRDNRMREALHQLLLLLEKLHEVYDYDYSSESCTLAHRKLEVLSRVAEISEANRFMGDNLFFLSSVIRLIYLEREIRWTCVDAITHGDLSDGLIPDIPEIEYLQRQEPYLRAYEYEIVKQNVDISKRYTPDEIQIILDTPQYSYASRLQTPSKKDSAPIAAQEEDRLLFSVASYMREGNKLFDLISERECADEFLQCLILSYERLQKYCEIVGEKKVRSECADRLDALRKKQKASTSTEKTRSRAQDGIKSLLGVSIPKSGEFDVFISHKKEDTDIAEDMYDFLKSRMKEPFFDHYSLPEMSESKYRKAIMQALDGSKHFVVVLSQLSYLESYWVGLEMEIFQSEIDEGRKPNSNFLIVVTKSVYDEIMASNKAVLPVEYRRCEIMRLDEYKTKLLSYLNK